MKKIKFIFIILSFCQNILYTQNFSFSYVDYLNDFDKYFTIIKFIDENKLDSAKNIIYSRKDTKINQITKFAHLSKIEYLSGNKSEGTQFLKIAVANGYSPIFAKRYINELDSVVSDTLTKLYDQYLSRFDTSLINQCKTLFYNDQNIRNYYNLNKNILTQDAKDSLVKEPSN